jgi:pimeloyl-ACP methyl ester carboxylesterase
LSAPGDLASRFEALQRHPDAVRALASVSSSPSPGARVAAAFVALIALLAAGLLVTIGLVMFFPPLAIVPVTLALLGAFLIVRDVARNLRKSREPELRGPALVADEHTRFSGGAGDRGVTTRHAVTLQFRDGSRREVALAEDLPGTIAAGDMGIASLQGDVLVAFQRVDV